VAVLTMCPRLTKKGDDGFKSSTHQRLSPSKIDQQAVPNSGFEKMRSTFSSVASLSRHPIPLLTTFPATQ